jgi:hypothetical protein
LSYHVAQAQHKNNQKESSLNQSNPTNAQADSRNTRENDKAWQTVKGWQSSSIVSGAKIALYLTWGFAALWFLMISPLLMDFQQEVSANDYENWWLITLPLAGILVIVRAIYITLEYRRFGRVVFEMDPYPGAIGGQVGGRILVPRLNTRTTRQNGEISTEPVVKLECIYSYISGSGKNASRRERIDWAEQGKANVESRGSGVALAFLFDLPNDLSEASIDRGSAYYYWRLSIKWQLPGVDLKRQYNIPVFKGEQKARTVSHNLSEKIAAENKHSAQVAKLAIHQGELNHEALKSSMQHIESDTELMLIFPMGRNLIFTVFMLVFSLGFGFASHSMLSSFFGSGQLSGFDYINLLFSLPFVLVAVITTLASLYLPLTNLQVVFSPSQLTVLKRWAFVPIFSGQFNLHEIEKMQIKKSGSTGDGVKKVEHFNLTVTIKSKKITIAESINGQAVAMSLAEYLCQRFAINVKPSIQIKSDIQLKREARRAGK